MEVSSENSVALAYFYPQTKSCPERQARAQHYQHELTTYDQLNLKAASLFPEHQHPHFVMPKGDQSWDDAEDQTMQQHLDLAKEFGVGFFWDLFVGYADEHAVVEMDRPFQKMLSLNKTVPFSVMFSYNRSRVVLPVPEGFVEPDRAFEISERSADLMIEYLSEAIHHPMFVRIDGRPVIAFGAFSLSSLEKEDEMQVLANYFKIRAAEKWGVEPYLIAVICDVKGAQAAALGCFDAITGYCYLPSFKEADDVIQNYSARFEATKEEWSEITASVPIPFFAPGAFGWDASLRGLYTRDISQYRGAYPHAPIIVDNTSEVLERAAKDVAQVNRKNCAPITPIFAWNEAEEGGAMLPRLNTVNSELDFSFSRAFLNGLTEGSRAEQL